MDFAAGTGGGAGLASALQTFSGATLPASLYLLAKELGITDAISKTILHGPQRTITTGGTGGSAANRGAALDTARKETTKELLTHRKLIEDSITQMEQSGEPPTKIREFRSQNLYVLGLIDEVLGERKTRPDDLPTPDRTSDTYLKRVKDEVARRKAERKEKARQAIINAGRTPPSTREPLPPKNPPRLGSAPKQPRLSEFPDINEKALAYKEKLKSSNFARWKQQSMLKTFIKTQESGRERNLKGQDRRTKTGGRDPVTIVEKPVPYSKTGSGTKSAIDRSIEAYRKSTTKAFPDESTAQINRRVEAYRQTLIKARRKGAER